MGHPGVINPQRLAEMARLSEIAYLDEGEAAGRLLREGWALAAWFDRGDTQGYLAVRQGEAALVFRGTETDFGDILTDLRIRKTEPRRLGNWPAGRVHRGFKQALDKVWPEVVSALRVLRHRRQPVSLWVAGHSLGGALAVLAAARVHGQGLDHVAGIATFGAPRIGDRAFAESFEAELGPRVHRVVNNCDLVPRLLCLTFCHVAAAAYLTRRGDLVRDPRPLFVLWDVLLGALFYRVCRPWRWKPDSINDHAIAEYRRALEALEART